MAQPQHARPQAEQAVTLVPPVRPFVLPPRIGVFADKELTLQQALAMALANNKDIEASRIDREKAVYSVTGAEGSSIPQSAAPRRFRNGDAGGLLTGRIRHRRGPQPQLA